MRIILKYKQTTLHRLQKEQSEKSKQRRYKMKTIKDLDVWRQNNPTKEGHIKSRYQALKELFGEYRADKIMRNLEIKAWEFLNEKV